MGADAVFEAVEGRPQFQHRCQITKSMPGFQERLVAGRDLLGGQLRVWSAGTCRPTALILARSMAGRPFFEVLNHRFKVGCSIGAHSARTWAASAFSRALAPVPRWASRSRWDRIRSSSASIREAVV
ncbi:hypothetical protein [Streptomyces lutosisoli]|uniref:hypothetical protein n=1 Tax=Streptomyces lutosisoli TaxID=2665721 RepID=UPI0036078F00